MLCPPHRRPEYRRGNRVGNSARWTTMPFLFLVSCSSLLASGSSPPRNTTTRATLVHWPRSWSPYRAANGGNARDERAESSRNLAASHASPWCLQMPLVGYGLHLPADGPIGGSGARLVAGAGRDLRSPGCCRLVTRSPASDSKRRHSDAGR